MPQCEKFFLGVIKSLLQTYPACQLPYLLNFIINLPKSKSDNVVKKRC